MNARSLVVVLVAGLAAVGCQKKQQRMDLPQLDAAELRAEPSPPETPAVVEEAPAAAPPPAPSGPPVVVVPAALPEPPPPAAAPQTYVVQKSDTLYSIARRFYGDGKLWTRIDEANRGKYKNPSAIPVGTVLVIPPK